MTWSTENVATAYERVQTARLALLDFDGPICRLFGSTELSPVLRQLPTQLSWLDGPPDDLFDVFTLATTSQQHEAAHRVVSQHEVAAAATAIFTQGVLDLLQSLTTRRVPIAIVTNNSAAAVKACANRMPLLGQFPIFARSSDAGLRMKPAPDLLHAALSSLGARAADSFFLGDSVSDMQAGLAAGVPTIGLANRPSKWVSLGAYGPTIVALREIT